LATGGIVYLFMISVQIFILSKWKQPARRFKSEDSKTKGWLLTEERIIFISLPGKKKNENDPAHVNSITVYPIIDYG
jgi:hypothetical protein